MNRKTDNINISLNFKKFNSEDFDGNKIISQDIETQVEINGKLISCYTDFFAFLFYSKDCRCWFEKEDDLQKSKWSGFYPFTCSCGIAGCNGIWDGIHSKHRKHHVEWRIGKKSGYSFLEKTFYIFDKKEYESQINKIWLFLYNNQKEKIQIDSFGESASIASLLEEWKTRYPKEYKKENKIKKIG